MRPAITSRDRPRSLFVLAWRMTSTSSAPASASARCSVPPSGARASAFGLLPTGAWRYGASSTVRLTARRLRSMTDSWSLSVSATYSSPRVRLISSALGCSPTLIRPSVAPVAVSRTLTLAAPQLDTYARCPPGLNATAYGLAPTWDCLSISSSFIRPPPRANPTGRAYERNLPGALTRVARAGTERADDVHVHLPWQPPANAGTRPQQPRLAPRLREAGLTVSALCL